MNVNIVSTAAMIGLLIAMWTMLSNFDKRNGDQFDSLQRQADTNRDALQKQIDAAKETLRAEMREMRAELRLEIRDAADRRVRV
jgi:hypothetical protein